MRLPLCLFLISYLIITGQILNAQNSVTIGANNELKFADNGQIRSFDDYHRILFRRSEDILELREKGNIIFSPGSNGQPNANMFMGANGNMGIGTTSPRGKLDIFGGTFHVTGSDYNGTFVAGSQAGYAWLGNNNPYTGISISPSGQIGVGTFAQHALFSLAGGDGKKLLVYDDPNVNGAQLGFGINMSGNSDELSIFHSTGSGNEGDISFGKRQNGSGVYTEAMRINGAGDVGIGTKDTKNYRLAVNGNAIFNKVVVKAYPWADYVFHSNYRLRSLNEVEQYINIYHHLPEVPTAEEVEKNGIDVGDNQATLLKKIEELTLYVIEQNKKIEALEAEMQSMKKKSKK